MDSTRVGSKWIKIAYHRPSWPPRPAFKRDYYKAPSPPQLKSKDLPASSPMSSENSITGTATSDMPDRAETTESSEAASTNNHTTDADSASNIKIVSDLVASINLDEMTLDSLSDMTPTHVLKIVTSGNDSLLRRLGVAKTEDKVMPRFAHSERRLDVIRYINKTAPVSNNRGE